MSKLKKRVTGLGGVFFKCQDPEKIKSWYAEHLGFTVDQHGGVFEWRKSDRPEERGYTAWSPFSGDTDYFKPSEKDFMFNYRVENLAELLQVLQAEGVKIVGEMETYDYGKFAHILDCEGNKIELWEPIDRTFDDYYQGKTIR